MKFKCLTKYDIYIFLFLNIKNINNYIIMKMIFIMIVFIYGILYSTV